MFSVSTSSFKVFIYLFTVFNREQTHDPCATAACQYVAFLFSNQIAATLAIVCPAPNIRNKVLAIHWRL